MEKESFGRILLLYLKGKLGGGAVLLLFCLIFAVVFSLYDLTAEAILYAGLLCACAGGLLLLRDFMKFYRRHRALTGLRQEIALLEESLPSPGGPLEADYQALVEKLREINNRNFTAFQTSRRESVDYYTAWVHQIKTPIAVMHMILQEEDTAEHKELLAELFRIEQYVDMVLCYFRLDSSSNDFVFRRCQLDGIIRQAVRKYAGQFVRKRIRLVYAGTDATVLTDEKWLGFILEQLLSNAVKYTEKGQVSIEVDENLTLTVRDTGIGIAPEDLPRIFEKGFTGYNGRTGKKSTGLGLYLCKRAADKLSHRIAVESEPGKGTAVRLDLRTVHLEVE